MSGLDPRTDPPRDEDSGAVTCACRKGARCLHCIERDGKTSDQLEEFRARESAAVLTG